MNVFKRIITYAVLFVQVLILVVLIFHDRVQVPLWLQTVGRMHPLLLHVPIGLLLIVVLLAFTRKYFIDPENRFFNFLLSITALTTSLTAFMGLILSYEGGYDEATLFRHQWFGVALSFILWAIISLDLNFRLIRPTLIATTLILLIAGHFGATLTHGEDFVLAPIRKKEVSPNILSDSSTVFSASIEPVLEAKCYGCHNETKAKGKLIMTTKELLMKGGKHGAAIVPGNLAKSLLVERLNLPLDVKEHMPPKDKAQLTKDELGFITYWIANGADFNTKLKHSDDTVKKLAQNIVERYHSKISSERIYPFEFVSAEKIQQLNIPNRTVFQVAANEPALQADFYLSGSYEKKYLDELKSVRKELVTINLSKMPVTDEDLKVIADFSNLEKLILNQTNIKGAGFRDLSTLSKLKILSLSGTKIEAKFLADLAKIRSLEIVYLWNTGVSDAEVKALRQQFSKIIWDDGFHPDPNETLRLSPAILRNEGQVLKRNERVSFKHNLPGVVIRYTVNGSMPDSVSGEVYKEPIEVSRYSIIRTRAIKEGWLSSNPGEYIFFPVGVKPDRGDLLTKPEDRYMGEGATTLIDSRKGMPDFYRDPVWMGFRANNLEAIFYFEKNIPTLKSATLSYARNPYSWCFAPGEMQVWGGNDLKDLKLLTTIRPEQPKDYVSVRIEGAYAEFPPSTYRVYKIIAKPLVKLPDFLKNKKEKGWLMVDEVFFN